MKKINYNETIRKLFFNANEKFRKKVIVKAKGICGLCGYSLKRGEYQVHHIYPRRNFPELKNVPKNGVCLCTPCHKFADHLNCLQEN